MTVLREIFAKSIDRAIDGVIKADDEASLKLELDEYVITSEIAQRLEQFLEAYNNYDTANGVWISGFFGSGKSHLLKMLAVLLENRLVEGECALEVFLRKPEVVANPMLAGALRKAVSIPSRSVLFNIDQKADVISRSDVDALLSVFQKVFDEMCGYYGKQPHIAQFERHLDSRGQLAAFRAAFAEVSGKPWEQGREQALLEKASIAAAFARATAGRPEDAADILSQYRKDTRVSIEDFAATVKAWIDQQPRGFRLNFFVDEVGQYISENVKLMTNLQTIAESLNTRCRGQAWLIVTSQQDMASVIGDLSARQENDFSKIMGRFRCKVPLNSADVAEVIQRRLLDKTEAGRVQLGHLHDREENNLRTLFDFADGSQSLKNFRDRDHFIASYPFPPYQYTLFQMAITSLSQHNAFEGKHSSVGERSMLGVFQEVAKQLASIPVGELATFDLMFAGIRSALKSSVQQSIQIAERNLGDEFAVRVLKALFLVKYVKGFKPTVRNIAVLLLGEFDVDTVAERRRIEEALGKLERETYIQRNGEVYEFLTNEEKDVEAEIKGIDIDPSEISRDLEDLAFDTILKHRKIRHLGTGHDYPFSRKLDDHLVGKEYELAINVISPMTADTASIEAMRMQSLSREELTVALSADARFLVDLSLYKKTDRYIRQANAGSLQPGRERIIGDKREQNGRRHKDLELRLRSMMAAAPMFVRGNELDIAGEDPQERITKAFQVLVDKVYVSLPMLQGVNYSEPDIAKAATADVSLFAGGNSGLVEAEQEILNHVQAQARQGVKASVKGLVERFGSKPYGWPTNAVLCLAASLCAKGRIEARSDSTALEGTALARALQNSHILGNILLTPQVEFTAGQIRKVKDLYKELFDRPADNGDARALGAAWGKDLTTLAADVDRLRSQRADYPFVAALDPLADLLHSIKDKPASWFITDLPAHEDALLDAKEQAFDPIRRFMSGAPRTIYDDVRAFLRAQDANFPYVGDADASRMRAVLADPACFKGQAIQQLKTSLHDLKAAVELKVLEERQAVIAAVEDCAARLKQVFDFQALPEDARAEVLRRVEAHKAEVNGITSIALLRDRARVAQDQLLPDLLSQVARLTPAPTTPPGVDEEAAPPLRPLEYIAAAELRVAWPGAYLAGEQDVDGYVGELRKLLLAEIRKGKRVTV
jgi:hypothetical protein